VRTVASALACNLERNSFGNVFSKRDACLGTDQPLERASWYRRQPCGCDDLILIDPCRLLPHQSIVYLPDKWHAHRRERSCGIQFQHLVIIAIDRQSGLMEHVHTRHWKNDCLTKCKKDSICAISHLIKSFKYVVIVIHNYSQQISK